MTFCGRHPGHPFLAADPLYALTEDVVTAVADRIPKFFSAPDEAFERDLARTSGAGFFYGQIIGDDVTRIATAPSPSGYPAILPVPSLKGRRDELCADGDADEALGRLLTLGPYLDRPEPLNHERVCPPLRAEWEPETASSYVGRLLREIRADGRPAAETERIEVVHEREMDVIRQKQEAYAMWLTLNPAFQAGLQALRSRWETRVRDQRGFPAHPCLDAFGRTGDGHRFGRRCRDDFVALYRRWGVERLLTWKLPLPLDPNLNGWDAARILAWDELPPRGGHPPRPSDPPWPYTAQDGVSLFLPWHLLRGRQFDLAGTLDRLRLEHIPGHLTAWLTKASDGAGGPAGEITIQHMFWLYRCYDLVRV